MEGFDRKDNRASYLLILAFILLAAGIIAAGYLSYRNYANHYRIEVERQLSAIAELKVGDLAHWRKERLGDAAALYGNEAFSSLVRRYFNNPHDIRAQRQIWTWLSKVQLGYSYERLLLFDARGTLRMSVPDSKEPVAPNLLQRAAIVMRSEQIDFQDFYRDELNQQIYLTIMVPILSKEDGDQALGVLVLRIDPKNYLYPFIRYWPTPSQTAETLLARREGNEMVFLNDLRFQKDTALKLRVPLEKVELPAVKAILGEEGIVEGNDYSGTPVIAAIRSIPDSPWFLTARMDLSEVYEPLKERLYLMIILVVALLIGIGTVISLVWRQQHIRFYRERHEAAATIRESEKRLLSITEGSPIPAFVIGKDHRILYWNRALEVLSKIPAREVIGTTLQWRAFYAQERPCMADLLVDEVIDKIPQYYEGKYIKSSLIDGAYEATDFFPNLGEEGRWLHFTAAVVLDTWGNLFGAIETLEDITDRKKAEEESRRLASVIRYSREIVSLATPDGTMVFLNEAGKKILGISEEDVVQTNVMEIIPEHLQNKVRQEVLPFIIRDGYWEGDLQYINVKTGGLTDVHARTYKIADPETGTLQFLANISQNITQRKQAEEEKKKLEDQNRQLQKAESLGRMAGAIAHTFNNQLGVVIGNLELALMDLPRGAKPVNSLTTAMLAANKAAAVSGQMLTYLGHSFDKREQLDLSDACRKSLPMFQAIMPGNVVLETDLPSPGPSIIANAIEIQQVLTNLITNAWEAVGAGRGSIHLRVKTVSPAEILTVHRKPIDWQPQDNAYACLEVTDTGCGIADKDTENIFDPFFSSKFTGRGMGLAAVLGIVKAHGGAVTVESAPGHGSTFRVFLPVSAEEVPQQPDKDVQPSSIEAGGTVLLVEDEEMVRNMAAAMLNRLGFSVLEAKDGVEAVEMFRQRQDEIRLVLSDLTMPHMDGWETLTALRKLAPDIPVILASGYDKAQAMAGDHPELPQVFLGKPYKLKGLSDAISQALVNKK